MKKREQWIENIHNHQEFTLIDQRTMRFSVCNLHFEANKVRKLKGRVSVEGPPTIFPKSTKAPCPPQRIVAPTPVLQTEQQTESFPLVEPQSCIEQYKRYQSNQRYHEKKKFLI